MSYPSIHLKKVQSTSRFASAVVASSRMSRANAKSLLWSVFLFEKARPTLALRKRLITCFSVSSCRMFIASLVNRMWSGAFSPRIVLAQCFTVRTNGALGSTTSIECEFLLFFVIPFLPPPFTALLDDGLVMLQKVCQGLSMMFMHPFHVVFFLPSPWNTNGVIFIYMKVH